MPLSRYKEGFERLGIVAFVVIAVGFAILRLAAVPYDPPADSTAHSRPSLLSSAAQSISFLV